MFESLGRYFELIENAERLNEECASNAAQVRLACAEAEQFSEIIGKHDLVDKFCNLPQWKRLGYIIDSLHDEEVLSCVAELLYRLTPIQEVIQVRRGQAREIIDMIDSAMTQQPCPTSRVFIIICLFWGGLFLNGNSTAKIMNQINRDAFNISGTLLKRMIQKLARASRMKKSKTRYRGGEQVFKLL